jgi:uncharacterized protein YutE (UPF0331/DUF86 family)
MRLNLDLLRQRAQEIRQALDILERYRQLSREEFISNQQANDAAKYRLIVIIEAAMSICAHLAARLAHKTPDSYTQCFEILASSKIIPRDLADCLGRMARFRNLLVHGYGQVDDSRVWDILQQDLGDLDAFLSEISSILHRGPQ